ncbi:MAG: hypothetical protein IJH68_13570 [Thermoguttaceae bacterium]|nr:hypothetical protein [Thermoguttaceae bacterium]
MTKHREKQPSPGFRPALARVTRAAVVILAIVSFTPAGKIYAQWDLFRAQGEKIEAEPNREYYLTDSDGLWFIMAKKFSGPDARRSANRVVYELRKRYKLPAYIFKYDSDREDLQKLAKERHSSAVYRYQTNTPSEYAVLVGSFPSAEDPKLQETLLKVKRSKLDSLKNDRESQRLIAEYEYLAKKDREYTGYGALGGALAVPNPLIPKEFFAQKGVVDPFTEKINSDSPYNLLNNKALYTVRVATFAGNDSYAKDWDDKHNRLAEAGIKAALLCETLRKKGIEAWEFHDHDASFVTIGSFDSYGTSNPDGTTEMNPEIYQLIERYRGELVGSGGQFKTHAIKLTIDNPKSKGFNTNAKKMDVELSFDLQPVIIMVPQRPGNAKRALQSQKRLQQEQENAEMMRLSETLAFNNAEQSRRYAETARANEKAEAEVRAAEAEGRVAANQTAGNQSMVNQSVANQTAAYPSAAGQTSVAYPSAAAGTEKTFAPAAAGSAPALANAQPMAAPQAANPPAAANPQGTAAPQGARTYAPSRVAGSKMSAPTY